MSKTTEGLDATGDASPLPADRRRAPVVASSAREASAALGRALEAGELAGAALLAVGASLDPRPPVALVQFQRVGGMVTGVGPLREGSYRGHPVFVPATAVGLDLLQALALLDELPLSDLPASERERWLDHAAAVATADRVAGRPLEGRFDPAHLDALLDASPPSRAKEAAPPSGLAAAIDREGNAAALAGAGALPLVVLRSGRPLLAASVAGDALAGALGLVVRLLDEGRALADAVSFGPTSPMAAVLIDDGLEREAAVSGCLDGSCEPDQSSKGTGMTSRQP